MLLVVTPAHRSDALPAAQPTASKHRRQTKGKERVGNREDREGGLDLDICLGAREFMPSVL